ncbi:MAG: hypothetical protein JOZ52_08135, partial [Acidobacteria bacterium]|nr:hypothetical protein [Acidobacteriota bacterium]
MSGRMAVLILGCCIVVAALILYRGSSSKSQKSAPPATAKSEPAAPPPSTVKPVEAPPSSASAPEPGEIRAVIERIYKDAATVDESRADAFTVGDFNGDDSQDIAIFIKPVKGKLPELNDEYANWTVEDPHSKPQPSADGKTQATARSYAPKIQPSDVLLTIIHGYQQAGWRNPQATQTYLLKNAAGAHVQVETAKDMMRSTQSGENLPTLRGDLIRQTLA